MHEVRFEIRRCVKMALAVGLRPGPHWERTCSAPPDLLAGFGEGNRKGKMERTKDRKGTEEEGKEWDGEVKGGGEMHWWGGLYSPVLSSG